ncbi:MAG: AraC family transcriptional regulator [Pseudomonadota bacterium]
MATDHTAANQSYDRLYGDLYNRFPQQQRLVGSSKFSMVLADQTSHSTSDPAIDDVVLRLVTKGLQNSSVNCGDGRRILSGQRGSLYVAPDDAVADWEAEGNHQVLLLALPQTYVANTLSSFGPSDPLGPLYGTDLHDPVTSALMSQIWTIGGEDGPAAALMVDGLITALIGALAGLEQNGRKPEDPPLDDQRLTRVREAVEANLHEALSVDTLAAVACLSPAHFSRRFLAAMGQTPHAYVLSRRIETARRLLIDTDRTLVDIAAACGFSGQSHFTAQFRSMTGLPPGRWRKQTRETGR